MSASRWLAAGLLGLASVGAAGAADLPEGYWTEAQARAILDKTITLRLAPDLSSLSEAEGVVVADLLEAGSLLHDLYLQQRHHQALDALARLRELDAGDPSPRTRDLLALFRLFKGPIATGLDNARSPFVPVDATVPGKNVYPWGVERAEIEAFLARHPEEEDEILAVRGVVRRTTRENLERDLRTLSEHPVLSDLQPGLRETLVGYAVQADAPAFYAVPYSVAYADTMLRVYARLRHAGSAVQATDPDFAAYLNDRARDMLSNDYESGDAAWVTGRFGKLNAQIGSYETYDDELFGAKSFYSLSLLVEDQASGAKLEKAIGSLQTIEDSLPYDHHKRVRGDIPVGVYNVIADFGQARGTNTATILPNDADHARKYGRTILLRHNIMTNPELFQDRKAAWDAVVAAPFQDDLTLDGGFQRTLWHEVGHYLGVAKDRRGRSLDVALQNFSDLTEEMKSDLASLYAAPVLRQSGYYTDADVRALYADGVRRTLQEVEPRRDQPYQTMQLMQMNWFLRSGLLSFDAAEGRLSIDYSKYHDVIGALLQEVLDIQYAGDPERAAAFVDEYAVWNPEVQGVLAGRIRDALKYRYRLVRYAALGE